MQYYHNIHQHIVSVCFDRCVYKSSSRRHHLYPIESLFILSYKYTSHGSQFVDGKTSPTRTCECSACVRGMCARHVCEACVRGTKARFSAWTQGHRDTLPSNAALQAPLHRCNYTVIVSCLFLFNCAPCVRQ